MLASLSRITKTKPNKPDPHMVEQVYKAVSQLGRAPVFYTRFAVPDTTDGRYDLLCLFLSLYLFRLQQAMPELAQAVFDLAFKDLERGLREVGVGDLSVSKHMKKMLEAFYGRAALYYEALEQRDTASLAAVVMRNLYNGQETACAAALAEWITIVWSYLQQVDAAELVADPYQLSALLPPEQEGA